jgi:D-glycero-alpha-D-manno-heptose-7-phosphate kinase
VSLQDWGSHPLLEAAIRRCPPPHDVAVEIAIHSDTPAGASTGTSAAVVVALIGALDRIAGRVRGPAAVAREAHAVETEDLNRQCGVQDQLCSAFGGINFIDITDYPKATVTQLAVSKDVREQLQRRLVLVYLGRAHSSSDVHEGIVGDLERHGPEWAPLRALRRAAERARDAVLAGDLAALGRSMRDNTAAQAELQAALVSPEASRIIDIARAHDAAGWKVNGAGGDGGSVTVLASDDAAAGAAMMREIAQDNPGWQIIPIALSPVGLTVR